MAVIKTKALVRFNTHHVWITVRSDDTISVYKYSEITRCSEWEIFTHQEQSEASDFILSQPRVSPFYVTFPGEPPAHLT